jgi:translocation and assembly module TamB
VTFPPPGTGEPRIDIAGRTRQLGYDVRVAIGGTLRAPEVTLSSVPPLPDDELLLLVLAGTPPGTEDDQAMKRILEANLARFVAESVPALAGSRRQRPAERIEVEVGRNVTRSGRRRSRPASVWPAGRVPQAASST